MEGIFCSDRRKKGVIPLVYHFCSDPFGIDPFELACVTGERKGAKQRAAGRVKSENAVGVITTKERSLRVFFVLKVL